MIFLTSSTRHLKLRCKKGKYSSDKYPSGEMRISVIDDVNDRDVFVVGSVLSDTNSLLELMILANGLTIKGARVNLIIPYLAYARQDKPEKEEPFAAKIVCDILKTADFDGAYVIDVHNVKLKRYFKFKNILPSEIFVKELSKLKNPVIIAPDKGGVRRAREAGNVLGCETACIEKERLVNGRTICERLKGKVKNRNALIIDDMIDTGTTIIEAAGLLKSEGVKDVYVAATHGLFSGNAIEKLEKSCIKKIFTTNTLSVNTDSDKIKIMNIGPLIEKLIRDHNYERKNNKALRGGPAYMGGDDAISGQERSGKKAWQSAASL